jgi:DNA-binding HxlR family transcriptional regulator
MAFVAMAKAIQADIPDPLAKWLLVVLADHADEDRLQCWPSIDRLVQRTGMSRATVARKLNDLEQSGIIHRDKGNSQRSTLYTLLSLREIVSHRDEVVSDRDPNLSKKLSTKKRGAVPENWKPSDELIESINESLKENLDHEYETPSFCDYHQSKGNVFASIDKAYWNWCRNSVKYSRARTSNSTTGVGSRSTGGRQKADYFAGIIDGL